MANVLWTFRTLNKNIAFRNHVCIDRCNTRRYFIFALLTSGTGSCCASQVCQCTSFKCPVTCPLWRRFWVVSIIGHLRPWPPETQSVPRTIKEMGGELNRAGYECLPLLGRLLGPRRYSSHAGWSAPRFFRRGASFYHLWLIQVEHVSSKR